MGLSSCGSGGGLLLLNIDPPVLDLQPHLPRSRRLAPRSSIIALKIIGREHPSRVVLPHGPAPGIRVIRRPKVLLRRCFRAKSDGTKIKCRPCEQARIDSANAGCSMRGDAYNLDTHLAISGVFSAWQFRAELAATTASDMRGARGNTAPRFIGGSPPYGHIKTPA